MATGEKANRSLHCCFGANVFECFAAEAKVPVGPNHCPSPGKRKGRNPCTPSPSGRSMRWNPPDGNYSIIECSRVWSNLHLGNHQAKNIRWDEVGLERDDACTIHLDASSLYLTRMKTLEKLNCYRYLLHISTLGSRVQHRGIVRDHTIGRRRECTKEVSYWW